jgi:creatinine amidohydrolase/Fe(II)-dependent formamide hydrolase-like protein
MRLNYSFYDQLEQAKARNLPLIIPAGNTEYHGPHCVCGCDTLIVEGVAALLAREKEIIIAPTVAYGPSSYAASGPEMGTLHMDLDAFEHHVYGILKALLEGGWRNITVLIHHQYDRELLFPMTLCYMKAAKQLLFDFMEQTHGRGWYARMGNDPEQMGYKSWIKVLPVMSREVQQRTGYDHAGKYECSLLMALYPEMQLVHPAAAATAVEWFAAGAADASRELGNQMINDILTDLRGKIS